MSLHDRRLIAGVARHPQTVFWRKQLIHRRRALEVQWRQLFPRHSFSDLHLIPLGWTEADEEAWRASARAYHEDRRSSMRR